VEVFCLVERWQEIALLVFFGLACVLEKTKCAICAVGFFSLHLTSLCIECCGFVNEEFPAEIQ
jgi:hypothetical protein